MPESHVKIEYHIITDHRLRRAFAYIPALKVSAAQSKDFKGDMEGVEIALERHLNVPVGSVAVIVWDKYVPYNDKGEPITGQTFKVEEHMSGFSLTHVESGRNHWLSDGVDVMTVEEEGEDLTLSPGTVGFLMAWTDSMNNNVSETLEAYFPDLDEDTDDEQYELLVVIDKRDPITDRERADIVSGNIGKPVDSMDEMGSGIDLLFHFPTVEMAELAEAKLEKDRPHFVQSITVNYKE